MGKWKNLLANEASPSTGRILAAVVTGAVVATCSACGASGGVRQGDVDDLRTQHEKEKARLDQVRADIAAAEQKAAEARELAKLEQCRATWAEVRAEVASNQANCAKQVAERNMCKANNSSRTAKGGVLGCVGGILAAGATGGALTPLALGGCGGGLLAGAVAADDCPGVSCEIDNTRLTVAAVQRPGRSAHACGGHLGVQFAEGTGSGALVHGVEPQSPASTAGIAVNDIVWRIDGVPTPRMFDPIQALNEKPPGKVVSLSLVRGGVPLVVPVQLGPRRRPGVP